MIFFTACGSPTATPEVSDERTESTAEEEEVEEETVEEATLPPEPTEEPALEPLPADPIEVTITTEDGLELVGTYFPASVNPAPIVIMMHWAPGTQEDWFAEGFDWPQLALILQNRQNELASVGVPASRAMQDREVSYGVLTFDFRNFGDSPEGDIREDGYLDALAAVAHAKTLEGADASAIMTIGASIGADGAVNGCILAGAKDPACLAAISLSPGNYIGKNYADEVGLAGDLPIACFASEDDTPSADTCKAGEAAGAPNYQTIIYSGMGHGMDMFGLAEDPDLFTFILEYFDAAAGN